MIKLKLRKGSEGMACKNFWKIAEENAKTVATWPKWMQKIVISAEAASTGKFRMSEKEWRERYQPKATK